MIPKSVTHVAVSAHPAFAMRGLPQQMPHIRETIARAKRFSMGSEERPRFDIKCIPSLAAFRGYLRTREEGAPVFIDIETPRDNNTQIDIVGISVSRQSAVVVPWGQQYDDDIAALLADPTVVKGGHNFAFDQKAFRANRVEPVWPVIDTIQAEALLYPPFKEAKKRKWLALATCVLRRFPGPHWKDPRDPRTQAYFEQAFPSVARALWPYLYCGLDVAWNWMLWERQRAELEQTGMLRLFKEIVAPAGYTFAQMEWDGVPVDPVRREEKRAACEARILALEKETREWTAERHAARRKRLVDAVADLEGDLIAGEKAAMRCFTHPEYSGLTNRSRSKCEGCKATYLQAEPHRKATKDLKTRIRLGASRLKKIGEEFEQTDANWRWLLFSSPEAGGLGLMPTRLTGKKGEPGVGKDDMTELQSIYPDVPVLAWRREIQHKHHQMSFVYDIPVDEQGRAHANFPLHKAENGRVSSGSDEEEDDKERESDAGNLQNITESDRQIFAAPRGYKWIERDGSQFELRVMAWLARAIELLTDLANGVDVHAINAAAIFGCAPEDAKKVMVFMEGMWQDARRAGKRPTHGWDYGLGDTKCGKMFKPMANRPLDEIREFLNSYAERSANEDGVSYASWDRRWRAAERAFNPELEKRKFVMRRYEEANTLKAREWRIAYFTKRWELARFQKEVIERVTAKGEHTLTNPLGRVLKFWGFQWDFATQTYRFTEREEALAFLPASTVGDMAKALMRPLSLLARELGGWLCHMGHDSFSAIIPDANVEEYLRRSKVIAERPWPQLGALEIKGELIEFRCPFEAKVGQNWGPKHLHDSTCKEGCERYNPDGLVAIKEAA